MLDSAVGNVDSLICIVPDAVHVIRNRAKVLLASKRSGMHGHQLLPLVGIGEITRQKCINRCGGTNIGRWCISITNRSPPTVERVHILLSLRFRLVIKAKGYSRTRGLVEKFLAARHQKQTAAK